MKQVFFALLLGVAFVSCKKDYPYNPHGQENRDNLIAKNVWQIQHIYTVQNNVEFIYERGGQNNTFNYDNDYLSFEKNGTGTYEAGNDQYVIAWQWDNTSKTELTFTIHDYANGQPAQGIDLIVKLENIYLSETSFRYAEIYTNQNGTNTVGSVYRQPKPGGK